jgi:hypothetical protein
MSTPAAIAKALANAITGAKKRELMQRLVLVGQANVQREAPVKRGGLRRSITSRVETAERGRVGTNLSYARYVQDGTRPHVIRAKRAKALSWPGASHPVRSVKHPGTKANPFIDRGVARSKSEFEREGKAFGYRVWAGIK